MTGLPAIGRALPLASENRWSDMLGVLIETDPVPLCRVLGLDAPASTLKVEREVAVDRRNRPDLVLRRDGAPIVVAEIKVLSGLGPQQLARYEAAIPSAAHYVAICPQRLIVDTGHAPTWARLTWEVLLGAYSASTNLWVATTANAWLLHLDRALPKVDGTTVWNDIPDGQDFVHALKTRMSWLFSNLQPSPSITSDLVESSAGVSSVVRMYADAPKDGYRVQTEIEERLAVRDYPKLAGAGRPPIGPSAWVGLLQRGVTSSADFDWKYLLKLWQRTLSLARSDWVTNSARPKGVDKTNHAAMLALGGVRHLGVGYGAGQVRLKGECMFGARIQFSASIRLNELLGQLCELGDLVAEMISVQPP